jgi:hypothetical protein
MLRHSRLALAALLACLIVTLAAAPAHASGSPSSPTSWWTWLTTWAESLWTGMDHSEANQCVTGDSDCGSRIDPDGRPQASTSDPLQADCGSRIDPLGGCNQ